MSKKLLFYAVLLVLLTGISTQATIIVPQFMLLLNGSSDLQETGSTSATYDEIRLDMVLLE
jgi:hypothetical protein